MIDRYKSQELAELLASFPAVALLGPRQVGKTTLANQSIIAKDTIYLDLEAPSDIAKLTNPELYLQQHRDKLVILDEVHRLPEIFQILRGLIDQNRRSGITAGSYLLLGSASIDLLRQSGESLAGRIAYLNLDPLNLIEVQQTHQDMLWSRGGFPDSFLAKSEKHSNQWRQNFIRTYLERDIPQFGPRIPSETLRRFWTMLSYEQSSIINASKLARNLGVDAKTITNYLDLLVDLLLVRRLIPWHKNIGKRLVKSPKVFVRDTGVAHTLLGIDNFETLLSHPTVGASWEAFVIENILSILPDSISPSFYRSSGGAEIDLVLSSGKATWAIEIKRSLTPKVEKGFYYGCDDVNATKRFIVYPGKETYPVKQETIVTSLYSLMKEIKAHN
ncbi:ATPase [Roseivirga sp. 4D4]|uniref:ATP-binding protein n=1 Tax=Roseivirga sp. 4D4 TaxID=1889784 RepID=UPI0008538F2F|nr:ATP-binding protein [Roseivirga sp. 4D4]OEK02879.1 ATPase [Roseivirga sp. 4D4]